MPKVLVKAIHRIKENIAPRPEGLNIDYLAGEHSSAGNETNNLGPGDADAVDADAIDPLSQYMRRIDRLRINNKERRMTPDLVEEMAACIEAFKDQDRYKNDTRLVKLCLEYGSFSESPASMFAYMDYYEIGAECSLFWYRWANYLVTVHKQSDEAKRILSRGLLHSAEPQQLLIIAIKQLSEPAASTNKVGTSCMPQSRNLKRKLMVYRDDDDDDNDDDSSDDGAPSPLPGAQRRLSQTNDVEVPRIVHERKENRLQAEPLTTSGRGTQLPSHGRLHVFVDQDTAATGQLDTESRLVFNELLLRHRIYRDPLRPFEPQKRRMLDMQISEKTGLLPLGIDHPEVGLLKDALYDPHVGQTELIGSVALDRKGDTELLK